MRSGISSGRASSRTTRSTRCARSRARVRARRQTRRGARGAGRVPIAAPGAAVRRRTLDARAPRRRSQRRRRPTATRRVGGRAGAATARAARRADARGASPPNGAGRLRRRLSGAEGDGRSRPRPARLLSSPGSARRSSRCRARSICCVRCATRPSETRRSRSSPRPIRRIRTARHSNGPPSRLTPLRRDRRVRAEAAGEATRSVGATVILVDGALAAYLARGDRQLLTSLPEAEPAALAVGARRRAGADRPRPQRRRLAARHADRGDRRRAPRRCTRWRRSSSEAGFVAGAMGFQATFQTNCRS